MGLSTSISKQLLASTILVAAGSIYSGFGQQALAGTCTTPGVPPAALIVTCTGAANVADVTQTFTTPGAITLATTPTFGLNTTITGGNGIETNGGTTNTQNQGLINAAQTGILTNTSGTNATTGVVNFGRITSLNNDGIAVNTAVGTSFVGIGNNEGASISSQLIGINADIKGTNVLTLISNAGTIASTVSHGINIMSVNDAGNVNVNNTLGATIQAEKNAVGLVVKGTAANTIVTNEGNFTSRDSNGIFINTDADTGSLTIINGANGEIEAVEEAINATVNGNDALSQIQNSGSITSSNNHGIFIDAGDDTGNVDVFHLGTGSINSNLSGIYAEVTNNETTNITSAGEITSSVNDGITVFSDAAAQDSTINIDVTGNITATAATAGGVHIFDSSNAPKHTATITVNDATITAFRGIELQVGDQSEVAITIGANAKVLATETAIVDFETGSGKGAKTNALLLGEIDGSVALRDNDDTFIMRGPQASVGAATDFIDGGDGTDAFTFDNVQFAAGSVFTPTLDKFETIELKNGSFIRVDGADWEGDNVKINGGNTLEALGKSTIIGDLENNGTVSLADGSVDDVFTVDGNLSGSGTFVLDANLDATQASDQVVIKDDVMGSHNLSITALSTTGASTGMGDTDGIEVVKVGGTAAANSFSLNNGPINAGAFVYDLHMSAGNDFYLQSMVGMMSASAALVPSVARGSSLGADALMLGYLIRKGSRLEAPINFEPQDDTRDDDGDGSSFGADILHASEVDPANTYWLRLLGAHGEYEGRVDVAGMSQVTDTDADFGGVQLGVDFAMPYYPHTYASLWGHYLYQENDVYNKTQAADAGSSTINSYGVGLGITYDPGTGLYFDALGSVSFSSADLKDAAGISGDTRGNEYFASAEIGYRLNTGYGNLTFIPQAQIKTHIAEFASYTDSSGLRVSGLDSRRSDLRLGVSAENTYQMSNGNLRLVGGVSWVDVFSSETQADLAAVQVDLSDSDNFIEGNLGFQYNMDNGSSIWASVNHKSGLDSLDSENTSFDLGFSVKF